MASVSAYPQSVTNDPATAGGASEPYPWLAPGDAVAAGGPPNDGNCATVFIDFNGTTLLPGISQGLMSQQCGFSVPPGSTIDGIEVALYMKCDAADTVADFDITLLRAGSRDASTTVSPSNSVGLPTSFGVRTFGGPADLWGVSWSPSDINDDGFGFDYAVQLASEIINPGQDPGTVSVDYTEVTVYYSASPTGTAAGDSSASAVGAPVAHATFAVTGVASASGVAAGSISAGTASGEADASGVGARTAASTFSVAGDSSAAVEGGSSRSAGTAPGEALAFGYGTSAARAVGMAPGEGFSIAEGIGAHSGSPANPTGIADGEAFASFAGGSLSPATGTASGEASASGSSGGARWRGMPPGCSCCGTSPPPPVNIPGCACQGTPRTLNVTIVNKATCHGGWRVCDYLNPAASFEDFTLTYQQVPAALGAAPGGGGQPIFPNSAYVSDPFPYACVVDNQNDSGNQYWIFSCTGNIYHLYLYNVSSVNGPYLYGLTNPFPTLSFGNTCPSPFSQANGNRAVACTIIVSG